MAFIWTNFPSLGFKKLSFKFLLNPLGKSTSGRCFFTWALIPSYLTIEAQYWQLTLAEVQFAHVYLLSSKSVSGFKELLLLHFLVKFLFVLFLVLLAKLLRRSLSFRFGIGFDFGFVLGFGFGFGLGFGLGIGFGFGLGFGFRLGLGFRFEFGFGFGFGLWFEFGLGFGLTKLPFLVLKEQSVFVQILLSDLSPHAHLLILSSWHI